MALTKPPVLPSWAEAGDKVQPTNAEIQTGWPLSNTPPARQRWNWILNFLANGVRYLTRRGLPDYGVDETYMIGDRVIGDDGKTYRSLQDDNINHAPSASPLWWEEWAPSLSRLADLLQKQTYTAFTTAGAAPNFTLTPVPAITAYAAGQRFRVKFHAVGVGADVLNVSGLGNKNLKQYDSAGAKVAAVIAANQLADVEYDGVDMVVITPLPSVSPVTAASDPTFADNSGKASSTSWVRGAMSAIAVAAGFAILDTGPARYIKFPSWLGGLVIQGGSLSSGSLSPGETVVFPLAFPNAFWFGGCVANTNGTINSSVATGQLAIYNPTATGMVARIGAATGFWWAVGK